MAQCTSRRTSFRKKFSKINQHLEPTWQQELGYKDKEIFEAYMKLSASHKKIIRDMIIALSDKYKEK